MKLNKIFISYFFDPENIKNFFRANTQILKSECTTQRSPNAGLGIQTGVEQKKKSEFADHFFRTTFPQFSIKVVAD